MRTACIWLLALVSLGCAMFQRPPSDPREQCGDACRELRDLADRTAVSCRRALRVAEGRRIEHDFQLYELRAAVLAWRDARMVCGALWTAAAQQQFEDTRTAVNAVYTDRARAECSAATAEVYAAVDADDLTWAEISLAEARARCLSTRDNRDRIIAAEKLLTQFRRAQR